MDEPIKQLLSMGWSCDDLLARLQELRKTENKCNVEKASPVGDGKIVKDGPDSTTQNGVAQNNVISFENGVEEPPNEIIEETVEIMDESFDFTSDEVDETVFKKPNIDLMHKPKRPKPFENEYKEPEPTEDVETVRNKIKEQLLLLRNKKNNIALSQPINRNLLNRPSTETRKKKPINSPTTNLSDVLISNDGTLVITDVVGGYTSPPPPPDCIQLTKTHDLTKIKGWRNKKFAPSTDEPPPPRAPQPLEPVPGCSTSTDDPIVPKEKESKSAFVSNALDEFLNEHSQLNISYEVPKLEAEHSITLIDGSVPEVVEAGPKVAVEETKEEVEGEKEEVYKPKTLAEKRRMLEKSWTKRLSKSSDSEGIKYGVVYHNGRRLKVPTKGSSKIHYIKRKTDTKKSYVYLPSATELKSQSNKKPSLLTCLKKPEDCKVTYKPGPLSKKVKLQNAESTNSWRTLVKKLPKITLEVKPEFRKPFHPKISALITYADTVITNERADFALSALKPAPNPQTHSFEIPFTNNQTFIVLRERVDAAGDYKKTDTTSENENVQSVVSNVIDKLLDYVEISELSDSLIKDDADSKTEADSDLSKPPTEISKKVGAIIKNSRKRAKTCLELKRLNVKIIDVDVAENDDEDVNCTKPYCRMGCVCKSLQCNAAMIPFHCGQLECMLECTCNFSAQKLSEDDKLILPAGTDLFSSGTMKLLQKQAKKNLARVEKEFTQTVIQSNDQTIILGTGNRERHKRAKKVPKKYHDYVDEDEFSDSETTGTSVEEETPLSRVQRDVSERKCFVKIIRQNLDDILPLCWAHNSYECACSFAPEVRNFAEVSSGESNKQSVTIDKNYSKPCPLSKKPKFDTCSRFREVPTLHYRKRNSHPDYIDSLKRNLKLKERRLMKLVGESDSQAVKHRRKQSIDAREDVDMESESVEPEKAMQRRKSRNKKFGLITCSDVANELDTKRDSSLPLLSEIQKLMGSTNMENSKMKLMPWSTLAEKYQDGELQIWYCLTSSKLMVTQNGQRPSKTYVNISFFQQLKDKSNIEADIVRWLVTKQVPKNKNPDDLLVVLMLKTFCWQICGMCDKKRTTIAQKTDDLDEGFMAHRDKQDQIHHIPLKRKVFEPVYLKQIGDCETIMFRVALPRTDVNQRWHLVRLNRHIAYLSFSDCNYTINVTDLKKLAQVAVESGKTIIARARIWGPLGVFAVPTYSDKVFVGPYNKNQVSYLEGLNYVKSELVTVDLMRKVPGQKHSGGCWLGQVELHLPLKLSSSDAMEVIPKYGPVIDLTENDEEDFGVVKPIVTKTNSRSVLKTKEVQKEDTDMDVAILNESKLEKGSTRYMVTNVPELGYIEASQFADSKIIDVRWPVGNHIQRFSKPSNAIEMLESDLLKLLLPVPQSFKIKVSIVTELKPEYNTPFDPKFMKGSHIVGTFGIMDVGKVTPSLLKNWGLTDSEVMDLMVIRSKKLLYDQCFKLAELLRPNAMTQFKKASEIIERAVVEIKEQEELYQKLDKEKLALEVKRSDLLRSCFNVMKRSENDEQKIKMELYKLIKPFGVHQQLYACKEPTTPQTDKTSIAALPKTVNGEIEIEIVKPDENKSSPPGRKDAEPPKVVMNTTTTTSTPKKIAIRPPANGQKPLMDVYRTLQKVALPTTTVSPKKVVLPQGVVASPMNMRNPTTGKRYILLKRLQGGKGLLSEKGAIKVTTVDSKVVGEGLFNKLDSPKLKFVRLVSDKSKEEVKKS